MNQKIIRKTFAFLALFAIVASLIWVSIVYIVGSSSQTQQEVKTKQIELNPQSIKVETKSWEQKEIKINSIDIKNSKEIKTETK